MNGWGGGACVADGWAVGKRGRGAGRGEVRGRCEWGREGSASGSGEDEWASGREEGRTASRAMSFVEVLVLDVECGVWCRGVDVPRDESREVKPIDKEKSERGGMM